MTYATGIEGFSAVETKLESLTVSYDSSGYGGASNFTNAFSAFGSNGVNYGNYNDGATVYAMGITDTSIDLSTGNYGTAVNIDASSSSGTALLIGNQASNIISGGSYYNFLYGGEGNVNDILVGGTGRNIFMYGKYEGSDTILNASMFDGVALYDVNLSDIVFTASDGNTIGFLFNTGNVLTVECTSFLSGDFLLADGSIYWYDCSSKTWTQTA